jgi:hypothetical protein
VNWEVAPSAGVFPETVTVETVLAAVVESEHALKIADTTTSAHNTTIDRILIRTPDGVGILFIVTTPAWSGCGVTVAYA